MSAFGDFDPEDAFDDGDSPDVKLHVLGRIVDSLYAETDRREIRRLDALRLIRKMESEGLNSARLQELRGALEALAA